MKRHLHIILTIVIVVLLGALIIQNHAPVRAQLLFVAVEMPLFLFLAPSISVSTTAGHVTLDGTVNSEEQIARAITLALETDGVVKVAADLKVKSKQ